MKSFFNLKYWMLCCICTVAQVQTFALYGATRKIALSVSVNGVSFTTRQVRLYMNFREALREQPNFAPVSDQEFEVAQKVFVEEMVVLQEQQRMSGYQVSKESLEVAVKKLEVRRTSNQAFEEFWRTEKPSAIELKRFLSEILSVNYYRQTRSKRVTDNSAKSDPEANWIKPLMERAIIRYYDRILSAP